MKHTDKQDDAAAALAAVAGLARQTEANARDVAAMKKAMQQATKAQLRHDADLAKLADLLAALGETTAAVRGAGGEPEPVPSWLTAPLEDKAAEALLGDVVVWLGDVYLRYSDAAKGLPQCWMWHPDVVEELVWLLHAWVAAYQGETASVKAAGDWHDRLRPGVVRRIAESYAKSCSIENHLAHRAIPRARVPLPGAAEQIAEWWSTARHDTGPVPTPAQLDEAVAEANRARPGGER